MKNKYFLITLIVLMCGIFCPVFSTENFDNSSYMTLEEYSHLFELGFLGSEEQNEEKKQDFTPIEKENLNFDSTEQIVIDTSPVKLKVEKFEVYDPYKEYFKTPQTRIDLLRAGKFTLFSDGKKELSDYMTNNFKSTMNVSYKFNKKLFVQAGHEVWYVNPNASVGAKKFYFNPRIKLTDTCFFDYVTKYNPTNKFLEQEIGLNFRPKLFKEQASFGIKGTAVINDSNSIQSQKLKFTTEIYVF